MCRGLRDNGRAVRNVCRLSRASSGAGTWRWLAARADEAHPSHSTRDCLMLSQGWITQEQLRRALDAQKAAGGKARIGKWLMRQCNLSEEQVTRALSMQWGCPVLSLPGHAARDDVHPDSSDSCWIPMGWCHCAMGPAVWRIWRLRIAWIPPWPLRSERMNGIHIEAGVVTSSQFLRVQERMMRAAFPEGTTAGSEVPIAVAKEIGRGH